jgi:hypothetical protein
VWTIINSGTRQQDGRNNVGGLSSPMTKGTKGSFSLIFPNLNYMMIFAFVKYSYILARRASTLKIMNSSSLNSIYLSKPVIGVEFLLISLAKKRFQSTCTKLYKIMIIQVNYLKKYSALMRKTVRKYLQKMIE